MIRTILLSICIVLLSTGVAQASVRISEIAWMGTAESQFGEWFELYNDGTDAVNLAGWKLYEGGGDTVVFTLTKSISAGGYLLVERTTASIPDPVPNINDEAGPFGGSGFSNSGENLVLKDAQGATMQSLDFSSGWPAGSAETKQTMQWDGTKWVTAYATPKAGFSGGGPSPLPSPDPTLLSAGTAWSIPKTEPRIELSIPKTIYTSVSSEYTAKTFLEYEQAYNGVFLWNMGDGTVYRSTTPTPINHVYRYSGTYTISFAYYKTSYDKKPFLLSSVERSVVSPKVAFRTIPHKGFEFTNTDSTPFDLSGWVVVLPERSVELPPFTIIASKQTVLMPFSAFGLPDIYTSASLQTPEHTTVDMLTAPVVVEQKVKSSSISASTSDPIAVPVYDASATGASVIDALPQDSHAQKPRTKMIIFGVVLLVVIGLFVVLERTKASAE